MKSEVILVQFKSFEARMGKVLCLPGLQKCLRYSRDELGRMLLRLVGLSLAAIGVFALIQSATGYFLSHDLRYLGMRGVELCGLGQGRIACFMIHDRVSFAGALIFCLGIYLCRAPMRGAVTAPAGRDRSSPG